MSSEGHSIQIGVPRDSRMAPYAVALLITAAFIALGTFILPKDSELAVFLFDRTDKSFFSPVYPFTIQNLMYVMVAVGLADLYVRWRATRREQHYLGLSLLPEDANTILQVDELGPVRRRVAELKADENAFLPRLIDLSVLQLMTSRSLEQTVAVFTSTLELMSHRVDLSYQTMRFLVWFIPTTGFIGTVVGISLALEELREKKPDLTHISSGLAVAFYTTIIALVLSAVLVFLQNVVQRREELTLNRAADYCLRNLINRVYTKA